MEEDPRNSDDVIQKPELKGPMVEEQVLETFDSEDRRGNLFPLPNIKAKNSVVDEQLHNPKKLDLSLIQQQWKPLDLEKDLRSHLVNLSMLPNDRISRQITKSWLAKTPNKDGGVFTVLDIPSALPQYEKIDIEIKKTLPRAWALTTIDVVKKAIEWWHQTSHLKNTRTMKTKSETKGNCHHLLLMTYTFLAMITLHAALYISKCRLEEGYNDNSRLNSISWIEPYSNRLLIIFNSIGFFLSVALMIRHFNQLPLSPWLLISVFSVIGTYLCTIVDTLGHT